MSGNQAKLYKATVYIVDSMSEVSSSDELAMIIFNELRGRIYNTSSYVANIEESDSFTWRDDININYTNATVKDCEAYFEK